MQWQTIHIVDCSIRYNLSVISTACELTNEV